ncbi:MAG: extracellular solute-binding protein [Bacilli bacterium]|nr:extracellular solute-binding protein [Bacilli bacterium]
MKPSRKLLTMSAMLAGLLLGGCGGGSQAGSSAASQESGTTKVVFWHTLGDVKASYLDNMAKKFNAAHEGVEVTCSQVSGSYDDLEGIILKNITTGNLPTMAFCYPDNVAEYMSRNAVVDMTSYVTDAEVGFTAEDGSSVDADGKTRVGKDDFLPAFWDEGEEFETAGLYCVPFSKSTEALFYNKDKFDALGYEVPTTWQEMWDLCETIRAANPDKDEHGAYKVTPLGYDSDSNFFITLCQQYGYGYTTNDVATHKTHFIFNNADVKDMLGDLKDYYDQGLFFTKGSIPNNTYTSSAFTAGDILMSIGSTGGTSYQNTSNFEVGVAQLPCADIDEPAFVSQGPDICFFNRATTAETKAAWEFYRYISSADNNAAYGLSTGYQPVRYSSYKTTYYTEFIEKTSDTNLFKKVAVLCQDLQESYFTTPVFVGSATARDAVGDALASVLLGEKTVDKALDDAMAACLEAVH